MAAEWRQHVPRELRRVDGKYSVEYLISIPAQIAESFADSQLFQVNVINGSIVLTPMEIVGSESGRVA